MRFEAWGDITSLCWLGLPLYRQLEQAPAARPTATATTTEPERIGSIPLPERDKAAQRSWSDDFAGNQFVSVQLVGGAKPMPEHDIHRRINSRRIRSSSRWGSVDLKNRNVQ